MTNYRPATAADIGRDDVQLSNTGEFETGDECMLRGIGAKGHFICDHGSSFEFARVPILPEEAEPIEPQMSQCNEPVLTIRRKLEEPYAELSFDGGHTWEKKAFGETLTHNGSFFVRSVTHAPAEQAIYLDGRYYLTEWIKSGVGVLPQQCTIEKEPHGCATSNI